jgi:hypothetical protein
MFGTAMPDAPDGNDICYHEGAVAIIDTLNNERTVFAEAALKDLLNQMSLVVPGVLKRAYLK